jgi:hypothetical protein
MTPLFDMVAHVVVQFFERTEEADEEIVGGDGAFEGLTKVAMAELVLQRDDSGTHWTVFVRALRPDYLFFFIYPDSEAQIVV